jgi:hypothetical protein
MNSPTGGKYSEAVMEGGVGESNYELKYFEDKF